MTLDIINPLKIGQEFVILTKQKAKLYIVR